MDGHLTKGSQPQTGQAAPVCMPNQRLRKPDKLSQDAQTRQAIPGFNVKNTIDKRGCKTPVQGEAKETDRQRDQRGWELDTRKDLEGD